MDERIVGFEPESLGFAEAAALPLTMITAENFRTAHALIETGQAKGKIVVQSF